MNILVTGASGLVGRNLCTELVRQKHLVMAVVRAKNGKINSLLQTATISSIDANTDWSTALHNIDVVVHLAARVHVMNDLVADPLAEFRKVNVEGTLNLAMQATKAGVKRFIFISSVKVNGEHTEIGIPFTETFAANPQDAYGQSKLEAEQGLLLLAQQTGIEIVIIRPPLVYGPGVKANFSRVLRMVERGIPMPLGAIYNQRSFVYVGNLVSLITRCLDHPAAANQLFLVSDGHDLSTTELLRACALALGVKSWLLPIPQRLIELAAALLGRRAIAQRLCGNLQVDISKARILLDWKPVVSVADGLNATALSLMQGEE
jgi:nucleoside-diphosphate-sugar epimerase